MDIDLHILYMVTNISIIVILAAVVVVAAICESPSESFLNSSR